MFKKIFSIFVLSAAVLGVFANNADANVGLPMIFLGVPFLVLAFIPVFVIEMFIYHKTLNIPLKRSGIGSLLSNILTTLVGYPISWGLHVAVTIAVGYPVGYLFMKFKYIDWLGYILFPLMSAWLMPGVDVWVMYLAGIFGLIPAFWISTRIESQLLVKLFKEHEPKTVQKAVWKANQTTYLMLAAFLGVMCLYHGLIKLHAFDFLRDRSEERVAFNHDVQGNILVTSEYNIFLLDLPGHKTKKVLPKGVVKSQREKIEKIAVGEHLFWFTKVDFDSGRQEKLYRYDLHSQQIKEISAWKRINKMVPAKDDAFVFIGDSYSPENSPEGIIKVSHAGDVQKVYLDGLTEAKESGVISPAGDKLAELKLTHAEDLKIFKYGPYLVQAVLRVYDLNNKEYIKVADLWGIFRYENAYNFHLSWHPGGDILYFSNAEYAGGVHELLKEIKLKDLKNGLEKDYSAFDSTDLSALLKKLNVNVTAGIYEYKFSGQTVDKLTAGLGLLGWSPAGDRVIVKKDRHHYELFNPGTGQSRPIHFGHLNADKDLQLTWSKDGKFIAYLGDSDHFLDKHHYKEGMYWRNRPGWVWIKELETGKERKFATKPVNPAYDLIWR